MSENFRFFRKDEKTHVHTHTKRNTRRFHRIDRSTHNPLLLYNIMENYHNMLCFVFCRRRRIKYTSISSPAFKHNSFSCQLSKFALKSFTFKFIERILMKRTSWNTQNSLRYWYNILSHTKRWRWWFFASFTIVTRFDYRWMTMMMIIYMMSTEDRNLY